ncbi:DUF1631 family protein [Lysobacter enzymogenes]|uniref:DUF1631 family protein n=1 Tax=Lysobacter enzymogenes TaxID=69 RepID=UPI0022771285|nr:DUF1631 family protein [Lysobacter enzymogenes]
MSGHLHGVVSNTRADPARVLEELKRQTLEQLGGLPGSLYGPIEDALKADSLKGDGRNHQFEDQAALWVLRQQQASHVMAFRQQIAQGFEAYRASAAAVGGVGGSPLQLVGEQQLAFDLDGERLIELLESRYQRPLEMVRARLQMLAQALGAPDGVNPIGPYRLVRAFTSVYTEAQVTESLRVRLFRQYEHELARLLGDMYARINQLLATAGYGMATGAPPAGPARAAAEERRDRNTLDGVFDTVPHREAAASVPHDYQQGSFPPAPGQGAGAGYAAQGAPVSQVEVAAMAAELAELRTQLHAWREGLVKTGGLPPGHQPQRTMAQRRELRVDEVVGMASLLQPEPPDAFARALAVSGRLGETIRDQLYDGARRLGFNPDQTCFSPEEDDAIDLVALLFDSLFRNHALQDRARRVYARLVMPYVKVALTDNEVFVKREHPARRLLDAITEACEGNDGETPQDRDLLERASEISQRIVSDYNEDLAVFELAHAELDAMLSQHRRRIELQEQRAAKATYGRERLGAARSQADQAVRDRIGDGKLTSAVADFIATPWRHHLVQVLLRENEDPKRRAQAMALGDALVMADKLAAENRGRELADQLLALQPIIIQCLSSSGLDESAAQHAMAGLVRALATPDKERSDHPQPSAAEVEEDVAEERRRYLDDAAAQGGHDPLLAERMRQLEPGDWLRLTSLQGETIAVKVAWLSPLTSRLLLVNRRGVRALVASAEELAVLASNGRLVVGAERTAFDEAMRQVRRHLDRVI